MFYLTMHSTHFIYSYMASDIWLRTILIVRKETRCRHIGYSFLLTARVLLYTPSHRQDSTYHGLCYTSRGELAGTRNVCVCVCVFVHVYVSTYLPTYLPTYLSIYMSVCLSMYLFVSLQYFSLSICLSICLSILSCFFF